MIIIFKYVWVMFIAGTFINGFILKHRSKQFIREKPELKNGYDKLFKGLIFYGMISIRAIWTKF